MPALHLGDLVPHRQQNAPLEHLLDATAAEDSQADMKTFYEAFVAKFSDKFASTKQCLLDPNYAAYSFDVNHQSDVS